MVILISLALVGTHSVASAGERLRPSRQRPVLELYAGKPTPEVEDCFCPEQLIIGVQVLRYLKIGASRTKMPLTGVRDEGLRPRRYGATVLFVVPF